MVWPLVPAPLHFMYLKISQIFRSPGPKPSQGTDRNKVLPAASIHAHAGVSMHSHISLFSSPCKKRNCLPQTNTYFLISPDPKQPFICLSRKYLSASFSTAGSYAFLVFPVGSKTNILTGRKKEKKKATPQNPSRYHLCNLEHI